MNTEDTYPIFRSGRFGEYAHPSLESLENNVTTGDEIKTKLSALNLDITPQRQRHLEQIVVQFEVRGNHALAFNTQMLGTTSVVFTETDRSALFQIFDIHEQDVAHIIQNIHAIDKTFNVTSDPFNILCAWLLHLATVQIKNLTQRHAFMLSVAKYLNYRFFTSLVNHYFIHGADENVMLAAINSLSYRYDIIVYGTWRAVIEARSEDLISPDHKNIHSETLIDAQPDAKFLYILSDTQTRLRDRVKNIAEVYYNFHKHQIKISSVSSVHTDSEGEKFLVQRASTFETMSATLCTEVVNVVKFVNDQYIRAVASQFPACSAALLRAALINLSTQATSQVKENGFDMVIKSEDGQILYSGVRSLITAIIEVSFHYCLIQKVSFKDDAAMWNALRNVYSSSQVKNKDILYIKQSVAVFVDHYGGTDRQTTKSSLRLSIIMYIVYKCLKMN